MKISNILQLTNTYKNNTNIKPKKEVSKSKTDNLNISSKAIDFQNVLNAVNKVEDIREDKIKDIADRIKNGTYNISAEDIANKMFSN